MTDLDRDGNTVPLDFQLGYAAGMEHGRADARDGKPRALPTGEGLWWDAYHQGYATGYLQQSMGMAGKQAAYVDTERTNFREDHP